MSKKRILVSVLLSALFLGLVFLKVPLYDVKEVLKTASLQWLLVAGLVLAGTVSLSGVRWYLVLHEQLPRFSLLQVIRVAWYGHFFNTILLGPAVGDIFKSTVCSKETGYSIPQLLATSWMDRFLAGVGSIFYAALVIVFTILSGQTLETEVHFSPGKLLLYGVALMFCCLLIVIVWKLRLLDKFEFTRKLKNTFVNLIKHFLSSPKKTISVVSLGCIGQIFQSSVLAWTLAAVTANYAEPLPWISMVWVFPVIAILSTLPISIGGVGVREGASLYLLGKYGVSSADAVAASLLCLAIYWGMGLLGGILILIGKPQKSK